MKQSLKKQVKASWAKINKNHDEMEKIINDPNINIKTSKKYKTCFNRMISLTKAHNVIFDVELKGIK